MHHARADAVRPIFNSPILSARICRTFTGGDKSELKPGTQIIIFAATKSEDGTFQAPAINYGRDGLTPPM